MLAAVTVPRKTGLLKIIILINGVDEAKVKLAAVTARRKTGLLKQS